MRTPYGRTGLRQTMPMSYMPISYMPPLPTMPVALSRRPPPACVLTLLWLRQRTDLFTLNLPVTLPSLPEANVPHVSGHLGRGTCAGAAMHDAPEGGDACDTYSWTTACLIATMATALAGQTQEKVLCHWCRSSWSPIYTCETTGPVAVLNALSSAVRASYEANLHPNP